MNLTVLQDASERIHYRDPAIPIYVSRGDLKRFSNMSALCHWHEDVELLLPLQGYLTYNIDGEKVTVPEGTAIFVNARHMHYGFSADGTDCDYLCITFRPELLCAGEEVKNRYVLPIVTAPSFKYLLLSPSVPEHRPLLDDVRRIDSLHGQMLPGFELLEISCLFQLWQGIFQLAQDSIYVFGAENKKYTDVDFELYGLTVEEIAVVRTAFNLAKLDNHDDVLNCKANIDALVQMATNAAKTGERQVIA